MSKHTLLIHHLEEEWREGMLGFGTSPEQASKNIIDYLESPAGRKINHVIFTRFEEFFPCETQQDIMTYLQRRDIQFEHQTFPYGMEREMFDDRDVTLVRANRYPDNPDAVIEIEDWHLKLRESESVTLCGAFDNECVQDAEDMLGYVRGVGGYERVDGLIVGSGVDYEPHHDYANLLGKLELIIRKHDTYMDDGKPEFEVEQRFRKAFSNELSLPGAAVAAQFHQDEDFSLYSDHDAIQSALESLIDDATFEVPMERPRSRHSSKAGLDIGL
ncbi:hypothetical protein ACYPKM_04745 [Pseudomonas aeruginosa]